MAILLLIDSNRTNPNPEKDKACYKRGDIVQVFDDDTPCVIPPQPPWIIVKVIGITKEQAMKYVGMWETFLGLSPDGNPIMGIERRRRFRIRIDDVPQDIINQIKKNRYVELTATEIKDYIRNMVTGVDGL